MRKEESCLLLEREAAELWRLRQLQLTPVLPPLTVRKDKATSLSIREEEYEFVDPRPEEMKHVAMEDLSGVTIDWKMLTTSRPAKKMDENFFSQLVFLSRQTRKTRKFEVSALA